jgi:signal transduction histidine kinase
MRAQKNSIMKSKAKTNSGYNQMRWVVLLLAVAVILPTVGLLWFISQVVSNERLAVRQKLITVYREQLEKTLRQANKISSEYFGLLDNKEIQEHPYREKLFAAGQKNFAGLLIYNAEGRRIYPLLTSEIEGAVEYSELFKDAWELEVVEHEFSRAVDVYARKAMYGGDDRVRLAGLIGKSRCLSKLGKLDEAVAECKQAAFSPLEKTARPAVLILIGNARLLLLNLTRDNAAYSELFQQTFDKLASMVYSVNEAGFALPADHNLFLAQALAEIARPRAFLRKQEWGPDFERLIAAEELSIRVSENFPQADTLENVKEDELQHLSLAGPSGRGLADETLYGIYHRTDGASVLALLSKENIASIFADFEKDFGGSDVAYRIVDESGRFVTGAVELADEPFLATAVGGDFPGLKIELAFKAGDVFEKAASEHITVYIWTGVLVIVLILIVAGVAAQVVRKQMKLNRLKNDFIATVSHELKTPLASIRLLVDTLLQGNYKDEQQAVEYFQMVSKENERLTRLIDNFLTFSRMERNKQSFEMTETRPADIAQAAAEAVKTKFSAGRCDFQVQIADGLPDVLADCDAIVTVLINLLDNARKYSYDDKKIELKVFSEDNLVCFSVKDNGVGMTRRQIRKIFDRFYQVDSSLSRRADGVGLGLSIVKFIVDAHKGIISVDSKPGEGSTFTVRLPVSS